MSEPYYPQSDEGLNLMKARSAHGDALIEKFQEELSERIEDKLRVGVGRPWTACANEQLRSTITRRPIQ